MKYCISMTWHDSRFRRSRVKWSHKFYDVNYIIDMRTPYIERFIDKGEVIYFFYFGDDNETWPELPENCEWVSSQPHRREYKRHHDSHAGYMLAAQYALCNNLDWVYIEHDALVFGLDKTLDWADGKKIVYGYAPWNYRQGWSEQCFMYVSNDFLPEFLWRINRDRVHEISFGQFPEQVWYNIFKDVAEYWPFGYGRTRPIDYNKDMFYAQQLTDEEIERFLEK